jgi:ketosteroid isomerase-like protein
MTTTTPTDDRTAVLELLTEYTDAIAARDADRVFAVLAADAVRYDLAPPLVAGTGSREGDADALRAWFATFDGPVRIAYRDPTVVADGDVAFVHALTSMTATPRGATESFTLWFRTSMGLRRGGAGWLVVHQHESVPFLMDGSFLAATGLEP